ANSFYKLTKIKVNPIKSILATNTHSQDKTINFEGQPITAQKLSEPFKYLGTWFCLTPNIFPAQKIVMNEIKQSINKMQRSIITEKQAIYIINCVLIPRLAYCLYSTFLKAGQTNSLTKIYTNLIKNKARLSRNIPNSFLFHPEIYALKPLSQVQSQHLATNFLRNINHPEFDSSFLKIRLQELQDATNSRQSILRTIPLLPRNHFNTYTGQTIMTLHSIDINLNRHTLTDWPKPCTIKGTPIDDILNQHPAANLMKEKVNIHNIRCIKQFLDSDNSEFLNWQSFHHNIHKIPSGQIPQWFTETQNLIRDSANPTSAYIYPNPFTLTKWIPNKKSWAFTTDLTMSKINRFKHNIAYVRHYNRIGKVLIPCQECELKDPTCRTTNCFFRHNINGLYMLQVDSHKIIHTDVQDLKRVVKQYMERKPKKKDPINQPPLPTRPLTVFMNFPQEVWDKMSKNNNKRKLTVHLLTKFHNHNNQNQPIATCSFNNAQETWGCTNLTWRTTTNAALTLYAFIATTLLPGTKLEIISNNATFIKLIEQTNIVEPSKMALLDKTDYPNTLRIIKALTLNIQTTLRLDKEVKNARPPDQNIAIDLISHKFLINNYVPAIQSTPCLYHLKTTIKVITKIINHLNWKKQNRIQDWTNTFSDIQINLTLNYLSFEEKPLSLHTNPTYSKLKSFKVKLLANNLPTYLILHHRNPTKYPNYLCPRCRST